jgi:hypothetical protein
MNLPEKMKFGIFLGPFHRVGENPTLALERDMELIQWLDKLGYDEAWIGEHHSAAYPTIESTPYPSLKPKWDFHPPCGKGPEIYRISSFQVDSYHISFALH